MQASITTGLERVLRDPKRWLGDGRVGLIANPTTVDSALRHGADLMHSHPSIRLVRLFGPEHGIRGDAQDMIAVGAERDPHTGLPVVSLYGTTFASLTPKLSDLADLDVLVFDVQDVGSRYYTYAATMALAMQAARDAKIRMVVLDRPNPIGGDAVEGGGIEPHLVNFCGLYPVPQRHGMTVGELARVYNTAFGIGCDLTVVECDGWRRSMYWDETGLPWVMPSPNMPTLDTALVYPGMCLIEGTQCSEGRGTTRPFELFGAPYIRGDALADALRGDDLPGVIFRPCTFLPTFHKFAREVCGGVQLHVTDRKSFLSLRTGVAVIAAVKKLWPEHFAWRTQAYEFRNDVPAIDLLFGCGAVREGIDRGDDLDTLMARVNEGRNVYDSARSSALIYT